MKGSCSNIYQTARKSAGMTQDNAAAMLGVSPRSVSDYESDKTVPPDDIVCSMIEVYKANWLGYQHLRSSTEVGQRYLPEIDFSDLPKSVLRFQKEVGDISQINRDMIEIACDGVIDREEKDKWKSVTKEIVEMAGAAFAVIYARLEMRS